MEGEGSGRKEGRVDPLCEILNTPLSRSHIKRDNLGNCLVHIKRDILAHWKAWRNAVYRIQTAFVSEILTVISVS